MLLKHFSTELVALFPLHHGVDVYMLCSGHKIISNKHSLIVLWHIAGSANGTA